MKKAFLVEISPMTRVVVDIDGKTNDEIVELATEEAIKKILANPSQYIIQDNFSLVKADTECPYNEQYDEVD